MPHLPGETQEHADASAGSGAGGARRGVRGPGEAEEGPRWTASPRLHLQGGAPGEQHRGPESQGPGAQRQDPEVPAPFASSPTETERPSGQTREGSPEAEDKHTAEQLTH